MSEFASNPHPSTRSLAEQVLDHALAAEDATLTGVAARWRISESTLRGWRDSGKESPLDKTYRLARRMNDRELCHLLHKLAGGRALLQLVSPGEVPAVVKPEHLRDAQMAVERENNGLREAVHDALKDNVITADEGTRIFNKRTTLGCAADWLQRLAGKCAGGRGR